MNDLRITMIEDVPELNSHENYFPLSFMGQLEEFRQVEIWK
jgi:hypothetical protein